MKIQKTLLNTIMLAVTVGTITSCTKSVESKSEKKSEVKESKADSAQQQLSCIACGLG